MYIKRIFLINQHWEEKHFFDEPTSHLLYVAFPTIKHRKLYHFKCSIIKPFFSANFLYMLKLALRYKNAFAAWSGSISSVLAKCF